MKKEKLTAEQLIDGHYYAAITTLGQHRYIFICQHPNQCITYLITDGYKTFSHSGSLDTRTNSGFSHYENATKQEIEHFKQCEKARRFVKYVEQSYNKIYNLI